MSGSSVDPDREKLIRLRKLLIEHFDLEELRLLCFDLGLDYEELAGKTKSTKMQDLITYLARRGELQRLIDEINSQRPKVDWPDFSTTLASTEETSADSHADNRLGKGGETLASPKKSARDLRFFLINLTCRLRLLTLSRN